MLKAFDRDSIGLKCLIFLNLLAGAEPTKFSQLNQLNIYCFFQDQNLLF